MTTDAKAILRKSSRKTITLPAATAAARQAGDLGPDDAVQVTIRKVRVAEVLARTGTPPRLFALARDRQPDETPEQQRERVQRAMQEDGDILQDTYRQADRQQRTVVLLGVVDPPLTEDGAGDTLTPDDLGDDFAHVHDQVVQHALLPYALMEGPHADTFLEGAVADDPEPDGGEVRDDTGGAPG